MNLEFDLFIGSKIGSLKHVKYNTETQKNTRKTIENLQDLATLKEDDCIQCMTWGNKEQTEILIGRKNQMVQTYDTQNRCFTKKVLANYDKGPVKGLCRIGNSLVTALESGIVKVWNDTNESAQMIEIGSSLDRMRQSPFEEHVIATAGKENDLKLWNISDRKQIFQAKNVAHDWLQLRVPVWLSDVCFLPESEGKVVAVCSKHGFIRLYDIRAQRRPVCTVEFKELPATCMTASHLERHVVVGFGRGQLHQVDLRGKGKPDKGYKGCVGAVTDLFMTEQGPYLISTSLDRYLRVYNASTKKLIYKKYLTSKLTSLLVQTVGETPLGDIDIKPELDEHTNDVPVVVEPGSDEEYEEMFSRMKKIGSDKKKHEKKKHVIAVGVDVSNKAIPLKKKKLASSVDDELNESVTLDDSIKRLLKSTEKTKKRLEKQKKTKKLKSVFNT